MAGAIRVCREPFAAHWQLGPLPAAYGHVTLIAWSRDGQQDGGVPRAVVAVLARAMTSVARVTLPSSQIDAPATGDWSAHNGGLIRTLTSPGIVGRTVRRMRGAHPAVLISTSEPDVIARAFDDAGFPWWMQGQVLLLFEPDAPPPELDEPSLLTLLEENWAERAAMLEMPGLQGAVRPGVDGAVAGALALTDSFERRFLETLEGETRRAGLAWEIVSEEEI